MAWLFGCVAATLLVGCESHVKITTALLDKDYLRVAGLGDRVERIRDDLLVGWKTKKPGAAELPTTDEFEKLTKTDQQAVGKILNATFGTKFFALPEEYRPTSQDLVQVSTEPSDLWNEDLTRLRYELFYGASGADDARARNASENVVAHLINAYTINLDAVSIYDQFAISEAKSASKTRDRPAWIGELRPHQAKRVLTLLTAGERKFNDAIASAAPVELTSDAFVAMNARFVDLSTEIKEFEFETYGLKYDDAGALVPFIPAGTPGVAPVPVPVPVPPVLEPVRPDSKSPERVLSNDNARMLFGRSIATDKNASLVAGAPEFYWNEGFNSATAGANIGNTDIAIKIETNRSSERVGSATVYALTMDAEDATRATFSTIKETVRFATLMAGVSVPLPTADSDKGSSSNQEDTGGTSGTAGSLSFTLAAEQEKREAIRLARTTRRATLIALDALSSHADVLTTTAAPADVAATQRQQAAQAQLKQTYETVAATLNKLAQPNDPSAGTVPGG
ncbi:MAG: hypothetical protein AAGJ38_02880 [Planctomycetota bacterium]